MKRLFLTALLLRLIVFIFGIKPTLALPSPGVINPLRNAALYQEISIAESTRNSSTTIAIRAPSDNAAERQVGQVLGILASKSKTFPSSRISIEEVKKILQKNLQARGKQGNRIEVMFIIFGGSNGDVPLISSVLQRMINRPDIYNVKHCLVFWESFRNFLPASLQTKFEADNSGWASRTNSPDRSETVALFIQKMKDILTKGNWNPDIIVAGHFFAPGAATQEQMATVRKLIAPSKRRLLVELQIFYMPGPPAPGLPATQLTQDDISPNKIRIYGQQPEIWRKSDARDIGAAMVGKLPRLLSGGATSSSISKEARMGEVYRWIDKQTFTLKGQKTKRRIFYMGLGMREREFDKTHAFPAFEKVVESEIAAKTTWSFIIFHNARKSESKFSRTTHDGRVFHLFVGETSWATLFPKMTVVLTHEGVGSMTDAIAASVPQILLPTDYAPDQDYFAEEIHSQRLPFGIVLAKIPYAAVHNGELIGATRITQALADVKKNLNVFKENIRPFQEQLAKTKALDNTFEIIDRMCAAMILNP